MCIKTVAERQDRRNFKARALFVFGLALKLHSCYMRMHSFSANQKRVISSYILLRLELKLALRECRWDRSLVNLFLILTRIAEPTFKRLS